MKDRPILFAAPMVRALLVGTKTQTRRVVTPQTVHVSDAVRDRSVQGDYLMDTTTGFPVKCRYGWRRDRLWVKETFLGWHNTADGSFSHVAAYRASGYELQPGERWTPSIHMPRVASRITLEVTEIRVERLQDISEADAIAEGIVQLADGGYGLPDGSHYHAQDPRISYFGLWEAINGMGSVAANSWVWKVEFRRVRDGR